MSIRLVARYVAVLGLALLAVPACGSSSHSASATASPIPIGVVTSETGSLSSSGKNAEMGAQAFVTAINAQGGYKGHPFQLITEDDTSTASGAQAAINLLISKHVFAIISTSNFFFTDDRPVQQAGIPVMGGITDGPEYGQQPFTNMFDIRGDVNPNHEGLQVQSVPFFKSIGATDVAGLALGISPSSQKTIEDFKTALQDQGLKMGYENLSLPYAAFDPTADVLQIKKSGVSGMVCSCGISTFVQFLTTMRNEGLTNVKSLSWGNPDPTIFSSATESAALQGADFYTAQPPTSNSQSMLFDTRLHAVDPSYQVGTFATYDTFETYLGMTFIFEGLQLTGSSSPTDASFIQHMLTLNNWTDNGLLPNPIGLNHFGTPNPSYCAYFTQVQGSKYVYLNNGKTYCASVPSNLQ